MRTPGHEHDIGTGLAQTTTENAADRAGPENDNSHIDLRLLSDASKHFGLWAMPGTRHRNDGSNLPRVDERVHRFPEYGAHVVAHSRMLVTRHLHWHNEAAPRTNVEAFSNQAT